MDVRVSNVVTHKTILPGTISLGTKNDNHATSTKIMLGMYVSVKWNPMCRFRFIATPRPGKISPETLNIS